MDESERQPQRSWSASGDSGTDTRSIPESDIDITAPNPSEVDWELKEPDADYPAEANYHCNIGNDYSTDTLSKLKDHIESAHEDVSWSEYLERSGLHWCVGCGEALDSLADLYCVECTPDDNHDRVPCRNCGEIRVPISDPFCSAGCASKRVPIGPPLKPPKNLDDAWLDHPHRLETGIPSGAPFISNNEHTCRECYQYGADNWHDIAVHVAEAHPDLEWGGYIEKYEIRTCKVCEGALNSLYPHYCSNECQFDDSDPDHRCELDGCENPTRRGRVFCSEPCYREWLSVRNLNNTEGKS